MKNYIRLITLIFLVIFTSAIILPAESRAELLQGYVQKLPETFWGTWRVSAKVIDTDSPVTFKEKTVDLWNISQDNNVIKLSNPFTGASAQISVENANEDTVEFSKTGRYDNKYLTDRVSITIKGDNFTGIDTLQLDTKSDVDGKIIKSETATYTLIGERISGQTIK